MFLGKIVFSLKSSVTNIPSPSSLSYMWGFGSILATVLLVQILTGLFISFHYSSSINHAFESVVSFTEDVPLGWLIRSVHANGASFFFICMFTHIARGLYFKSFSNFTTWVSGVVILFLSMGTAFLGYVLPWGQMSYWGATVITNLLSALPWGESLVVWVWGGFSVSGPTLSRFYSLHFLLPFVILVVVLLHLLMLHSKGSQNPLGVGLDADKIFFHPLFTVKDIVGIGSMIFFLSMISMIFPDIFMDPDNFSPANSMSTPVHIQPEWYFLFAYAILRSIPSKLGGVIALLLSVAVLVLLPLLGGKKKSSLTEIVFWTFACTFVLLSWVGAMPVEGVLVSFGQVLSVIYFLTILLLVFV